MKGRSNKPPRICGATHPMTTVRCILDPPGHFGRWVYLGHRGPHWGCTPGQDDYMQWPKQKETAP